MWFAFIHSLSYMYSLCILSCISEDIYRIISVINYTNTCRSYAKHLQYAIQEGIGNTLENYIINLFKMCPGEDTQNKLFFYSECIYMYTWNFPHSVITLSQYQYLLAHLPHCYHHRYHRHYHHCYHHRRCHGYQWHVAMFRAL